MSPSAKNVLRTLMLGDALVLGAVGAIAFWFVDGTPGVVAGFVAWAAAAVLIACLPLTDPYRWEKRERRASR